MCARAKESEREQAEKDIVRTRKRERAKERFVHAEKREELSSRCAFNNAPETTGKDGISHPIKVSL